MRTTRPVNKRYAKPAPIQIRWKKVLKLPILASVIVLLLFGAKFALDQNDLRMISSRTAQYNQELLDYQNAHPNEVLLKKIIAESDKLAAGYDYDKAIELLKSNSILQTEDEVLQRITSFQNEKNALIAYTKEIPILFFHILISDPKIAFGKTSHNVLRYKSRYVTTYEFKEIINQMLEREYVLVDFFDVFEEVNGIMARKELKLPTGKLPFILMEDEMDYSDPMPLDGFARGLVLENGDIVARVLTTGGIEKSSDGDLVPIVENFIKEHPEFSYRGARGILSLTGFAGTLGYRLSNKADIANAKAVATALKEKGWIFGCTSFNDLADTYVNNPTAAKITEDLTKWDAIIKPIVGPSTLFISPYGNILTGQNLLAIRNFGYRAYFTSDNELNTYSSEGMLFLPRIFIEGESFNSNAAYLNANFFNVDEVLDPVRAK